MTYKEIMDKISALELKLAVTTGGRQKQKIKKEIQRLTRLKENANKKQYGSRSLDLMKNKIEQTPILNKNTPERKPTDKQLSERIRNKLAKNREEYPDIFNPRGQMFKDKGSVNEIKTAEPISKRKEDKTELRKNIEANMMNASENQGLGGTMPTDAEMNVLEKFVSKLVGRNVRFEDIPDDDPDFDVGYKSEGHFAYPAGRPDLKKGGMTAKSAATTEFRKPLGMKGGGLTRSQKQRIARLTQEYKQKKARKSNGKRTNR